MDYIELNPKDYDTTTLRNAIVMAVARYVPHVRSPFRMASNDDVIVAVAHKVAGVERDKFNLYMNEGFANKVKRLLTALANEGTIIKHAKVNYGGAPGYRTPEQEQFVAAILAALKEEADDINAHADHVLERARAHGLPFAEVTLVDDMYIKADGIKDHAQYDDGGNARIFGVSMPLDVFERLITEAGA